jgi:hypothetical protein
MAPGVSSYDCRIVDSGDPLYPKRRFTIIGEMPNYGGQDRPTVSLAQGEKRPCRVWNHRRRRYARLSSVSREDPAAQTEGFAVERG